MKRVLEFNVLIYNAVLLVEGRRVTFYRRVLSIIVVIVLLKKIYKLLYYITTNLEQIILNLAFHTYSKSLYQVILVIEVD